MLNRKAIKSSRPESKLRKETKVTKAPVLRRRFVLTSAKLKAAHAPDSNGKSNGKANGKSNGHGKVEAKADPKGPAPAIPAGIIVNPTASGIDLTETVKTL